MGGETLIGYAMAIPGSRNGHPYLHSHMVAVKEGYRNTGLGRTIKLFQREDAIAHGYELMEWTFDPLEIKNSYFNLERLGAIARRYNVNQYGITNSPLQGFLPTDRLVAEWWMKSRRVETVLSTGHHAAIHEEERVEVPAEIYAWKADPTMRPKALQTQSRNRESVAGSLFPWVVMPGLHSRRKRRWLLSAWPLGRELVVYSEFVVQDRTHEDRSDYTSRTADTAGAFF